MSADSDIPDSERGESEFRFARFPIRLNLPRTDKSLLETAAEAIHREYLDSTRWKRLRCRGTKLLSSTAGGVIYELHIGGIIDFDWTWEGAVAFRPTVIDEHPRSPDERFSDDRFQQELDSSVIWSGEILEVDEAKGKIYIAIANPEYPPRTGTFFVKPFEFLTFLHAVYHESAMEQYRTLLPGRLLASEGDRHPHVENYKGVGLPELDHLWRTSWGVLWGPPGTGKTYTTGKQIASALSDPSERILVISTTNKATDAAAISIGRAVLERDPASIMRGTLLRIGKGASLKTFETAGLKGMLKGTETELLGEVEQLSASLSACSNPAAKAQIRMEMKKLRLKMRDAAKRNFFSADIRVVVSTAFRATTFLKSDEVREFLEQREAPFTTVVIDEAGLISRASVAVLSLLASRRVILVGDSKQLAPISRISRLLPSDQMVWLASSGVSHLRSLTEHTAGVHVLKTQYRMHPSIGNLISKYQYNDSLVTGDQVGTRKFALPDLLYGQPRTIWYVLDDAGQPLPTIRAQRGRGNRSWVRVATMAVMEDMFADLTLRTTRGMFISPFRGQVQKVAEFFAKRRIHSWSAATVHSQQGSEADIVIFDTVNAGSYAWPYDEWKRLINVAISRAREAVILLASRAEMEEPFLMPLVQHLHPQVIDKAAVGKRIAWKQTESTGTMGSVSDSPAGPLFQFLVNQGDDEIREQNSIGYQIAHRKALRPILSQEQQRLCGLELDGKPRLVRGVAGSGKTVVLANWMMQTVKHLEHQPDVRIWAVFANRSLQGLIGGTLQSAWSDVTRGQPFPWDRVSLHHVRELLAVLLREVELSIDDYEFNYDAAASAYLSRIKVEDIRARCEAMFVDEAQDMGPSALKVLSALVKCSNDIDFKSRSINIFYDNDQNVYARATPVWSEFGLDMRGRSTVMKESFRSSNPVTEYALNVLYALAPPVKNADHRELVKRSLIEKGARRGRDWWTAKYNQIAGPKPTLQTYPTISGQLKAIAASIDELVTAERVEPIDITILFMGRRLKRALEQDLAPLLTALGLELSIQTNASFSRHRATILASTPHSFKGYDSEVIIIPGADHFVSSTGDIQANSLYVAMTRARSILKVFTGLDGTSSGLRLIKTLEECMLSLCDTPVVEAALSTSDEMLDLLDWIGAEHRDWLKRLSQQHELHLEPLVGDQGEVLCEPLFWFKSEGATYACFGKVRIERDQREYLEQRGIRRIEPRSNRG